MQFAYAARYFSSLRRLLSSPYRVPPPAAAAPPFARFFTTSSERSWSPASSLARRLQSWTASAVGIATATGTLRAIGAAAGFTLTVRVDCHERDAAGVSFLGSSLDPDQFATTSPATRAGAMPKTRPSAAMLQAFHPLVIPGPCATRRGAGSPYPRRL